jgi:cob(I)alamin adenosyltransferase
MARRRSPRATRETTLSGVKIYTRTGDGGETGLFAGGRVPKDHPRVAAYGDVDELNAALGAALALEPAGFEADLLTTIQRDLLTVGAELATPDPAKLAKALSGPPIGDAQVAALERAIDRHDDRLPPLRSFILPGGTPKAAALHLARTVCRRAERSVVRLAREAPVSPAVLRYLNRLSDLVFVLARAANAQAGARDTTW